MKLLIVLAGLLLMTGLSAQEQDSLDWDIASVFDEPELETPGDTTPPPPAPPQSTSVSSLLQRPGIRFTADYAFHTGLIPGWHRLPWAENWNTEEYFLDRFIGINISFAIDTQISQSFRVFSRIHFDVPSDSSAFAGFRMGDFFFDYSLFNTVFLRGGKYDMSWGISPNYGFSNLVRRIPEGSSTSDTYTLRLNIPVGRGGFQFVTLTRAHLMRANTAPQWSDFGVGGKYNFAHRFIDVDAGGYYQDGMPFRAFVSLKTTLWDIELYNEWVAAIADGESETPFSGAFNIGFARSFFDERLELNGEFLFNAEKSTFWYRPQSSLRSAAIHSFLEGPNLAFNVLFRPWRNDQHFFVRLLYAPAEQSAQIVPGVRIRPIPHLELSLAVLTTFGDEDGHFFQNTMYETDLREPLPFAIMFMVSLRGRTTIANFN